jgi:eukaryotic-like serine/threonine-protein kinase
VPLWRGEGLCYTLSVVSQPAVATAAATTPVVIGRYALFDELAAGGMATVHLGRLLGSEGFGRTVAVKRLHAHYLKDEEFVTMFMDEARIVARIRHPNVVPMVDVVQGPEGLFLVMEYVHGESLSRLMRTARKSGEPIPPRIVAAIMCGVLLGLHAAHETKGADGQLLGVVHRDVSPQNVIVGADGTARMLDFGIAKAAGRAQVTREGQIKGKLAYMAPEQIRGQVDRRTDVFAASVVLWELFAGRRLHDGLKDVDIVTRVVQGNFQKPSQIAPHLTPEIDDIVLRGLETDPKKRYATARELALELERKVGLASATEVSEWVERLAHDVLEARSNLVSAMELAAGNLIALVTDPPPPMTLPEDAFPNGNIPVHLDPLAPPHQEVPSTSAVFAHAQTANDAPVAGAPSTRSSRGVLVALAICAFMALIGLILGAYALANRGPTAAPPSPPSASPLSPKPLTPPSIAPTSGAESAPATSPAVATSAAPVASASAAPSASSASSAGSSASSASAATSATARPAPFVAPPAPPPVRKPTKSCDPPYTLDDVGHRHYKPECMGL